jgi:hypothetical protein
MSSEAFLDCRLAERIASSTLAGLTESLDLALQSGMPLLV